VGDIERQAGTTAAGNSAEVGRSLEEQPSDSLTSDYGVGELSMKSHLKRLAAQQHGSV